MRRRHHTATVKHCVEVGCVRTRGVYVKHSLALQQTYYTRTNLRFLTETDTGALSTFEVATVENGAAICLAATLYRFTTDSQVWCELQKMAPFLEHGRT